MNLLRKLRFQVWDERDGDPKAFVFGRNIERRHLNASQRAQIAVTFNERFGWGGDRSKSSRGNLKTRKALAEKANVGTSTIGRAVAVENVGRSAEVIAGEKTATQVIAEMQPPEEREANRLLKKKKQVLKAMWDSRKQAATDYVGDGDTDLNQHLSLPQLEKGFARSHENIDDAFNSGMERTSFSGIFATYQDRALESDVSLADLEKESKAISIYALDILLWQKQDWIQQLIAEKKGADSVSAEETATESEPDTEPDALQSLWEQVNPKISAWKQKREGVSHASKTMLLHATLKFHGLPSDTPTTPDILEKLLHLLTRRTDILEVFVKKQLRGESLWRDEGDDASGPAIATATETDVDTEAETDAANLVDEGLSGIDLHGLDDTLSALLESLNADEMSGSYKEVLTADLHDVFLQFKEVANAREMLIALLDAAQIVVSKFLP